MRSPPHRRGWDDGARSPGIPADRTRVKEILQALFNVLREAQARGIELSASFLHFDRRRNGLVGVDELMEALVELQILSHSIVWSEEDVEECVYEISAHRSNAYFSREDFIVFFSKSQLWNDENMYRNEASTQRQKRGKPMGRVAALMNDEEPTRVTFSLSNNDVNTDAKVEFSVKKAAKKRPLGSLLPNWAHARSKRALKELEELSKKRGRVVRPTSQGSAAGVPPEVPALHLELPVADEEAADIETDRTHDSTQASARSTVSSQGDEAHGYSIVQLPTSSHYKEFALDEDTLISYVILERDPVSFSPRRLPKPPGVHVEDEEPAAETTAFRFTVFLDAFQRIETLEAFFSPLLDHFPRGKVLICGFPTKMRRQTVLNDVFLASAYAKLLLHLIEATREWLVQPKLGVAAVPQYVVAVGSGAQAAVQLLTTEIPIQASDNAMMELFLKAQRGLVLVNALVNIDKRGREAWQSWRRMLQGDSSVVEWHEALAASMFSASYLSQTARVQTMEKFLASRASFLQGPGLALLQSLVQGVVKSTSTSLANLAAVTSQPFGVVAVHSTSDSLSPATQVEILGKALPVRVESVAECLAIDRDSASPPLHVAWLKSGHEVLQERTAFLLELLRQLVLAPTTVPSPAVADTPEQTSSTAVSTRAEDVASRADEAPHSPVYDSPLTQDGPGIVAPSHPAPTLSLIAEQVQQELAQRGLKWIQQELYDRDLDGGGPTDSILRRYEQVLLSEARAAREKREKEAAKQLSHAAFDAEKKARQAEAIERAVRAQETIKALQRKEHEAQKAFFAEMERQKLAHAQWLDEHRCIELEDALSAKFNDQCRLQEMREDRNDEMGRQVAALAKEREEQAREAYQVELQRQRLAHQHAQREALKTFQQEFEQNQFVCSAVDEYQLDLAPEYANFPRIVAGTRVLAHDLARFYELKALQLDESVAKRQQLDKLKVEISERELSLRNRERVVAKAKHTGMVARAGLGTVRVVAVSAAEIQQLVRELDEHRDALAAVLHAQTLASQQLQWQDKMLQRLSVLIKRNEGFRVEVLGKMTACLDTGNEMVLCVREDMEALMDKREANEALVERARCRLHRVEEERARAEAATTQYVDTALRVEGATQRVLKTVLLQELGVEKETLSKRLTAAATDDAAIRTRLQQLKAKLEEYGGVTVQVEQARAELEAVVPVAAKKQATVESEETETEAVQDGSLADRVRRKSHAERSDEEKQWVAIDFALHFAYYYKHIELPQVELIEKHPDYQRNSLSRPQLERLLTLPPRNCLALAFIKSQAELEAHFLLRKYTFGDGDDHFQALDRAFELPGALSAPATVVATLEEAVLAAEKAAHPTLRGRSVLLLESDAKPPPLALLSASQQQIAPHKTVTHSFKLPATAVGVLSLTVSIVFQGHFQSTGYQCGRLAAMLYALPSSATAISGPVPIGQCATASDIALCTPHSLGKLVLRHDPMRKPVCADVVYQVVLGAPVWTTYSIEITASTAVFASEALRRKRADALKKQELLPVKKDEIRNVFTTIQLSERKKRLARKMALEAKETGRQAELQLLRFTKQLEDDNALPVLPQAERQALHAQIRTAEATFTRQCFLFAQREEEVRDIEGGLQQLTKIHAELLETVDKMERDLVEYRTHLPPLAAVLCESEDSGERDAAGARLARELNVEYASRFGARSGKVFWAELSAMKAKLPSMMTPAERLRRKYKKGAEPLEKKEREWVLLDRVLFPRLYEWEERLVATGGGDARMRLHGVHPRLSKDEEQLAVLSQMEVERIMKAPWNLLERREIQVRKIVTRFRDDTVKQRPKPTAAATATTSVATMLRGLKASELTGEEREWRAYDQVLNPVYYPRTLKTIAEDVASPPVAAPPHITREDLVAALNTPEDELFQLPSDLLKARNLLLKFDPQLSVNLVEAARMQHAMATHSDMVEKVEMDVDARCRLVYAELQRAIANTRNEFMDSSALHTTLQRFPTKVLRLELEKELDRLLMAQIVEKEQHAMALGRARPLAMEHDAVSDSDSDEEAVIAREARDREARKRNARGTKVRGKAMATKAVQRQRREIKDALQGRSLEEQRLVLAEKALGDGGCMACRTNPCVWQPYLQASLPGIQSRVEQLQEELERVKRSTELVVSSTVCLAAVKSGHRAVAMRKADLFDELTAEIKTWDRNLRLRNVDHEFHDTFTSKEVYFETQALHGFRQIQHKDKVQRALLREHNVLVANLTAYEVVEDILEYMLEGWVFGERESERKVLGFVPSLKRDGPLTMHDLRRLEQERREQEEAQRREAEEVELVQGTPLEKWKPIQAAAFEIDSAKKAVKKGSTMDKQLTETEQALKFGIFCMTLMYFRGLSLLKKQKAVWSTSALKAMARQQPVASAERKRMELEARNVAAREKKAQLYDEKARLGQARKAKLEQQRVAAYRQRMVLENQRAKKETHAAVQVQRIFRGFTGRRAGKRWMVRRREIDAQRALDRAAAITLQRAYRGRLGRLRAEERRIELAEFISQIRAEEAIEEEEEYWRTHRLERVARQVGAYIKKQA